MQPVDPFCAESGVACVDDGYCCSGVCLGTCIGVAMCLPTPNLICQERTCCPPDGGLSGCCRSVE
jgi:hypothetical protein